MLRYETLYLTVPEITADEVTAIERQIDKLIKESQGSLLSFERWGKYALAYPVRKNDYGVYFLVRFEVPRGSDKALLENISTLLKVRYNELVMRFMISVLDPRAALTYQRPASLEEAPARNEREGSIFKERGQFVPVEHEESESLN